MSTRIKWRWALIAAALLLTALGAVGKPVYLWTFAWLQDQPATIKLPPQHVDDASRLNPTRVAEVWPVPKDMPAAEEQLRQLLARARQEKLPIAIGGAR